MELVERPLVRDKDERRGPDFLLLYIISTGTCQLNAGLTLEEGGAVETEKQVAQLVTDLTALKNPLVWGQV